MPKTHNLFISHSWKYGDAYEKLVDFLDERSYFLYKNHSVPKHNPILGKRTDEQLYQAIKSKISGTHVVIILAGVYASHSEWIDKEIYIAKNEFYSPKPILAIQPWGAERTSKKVKDNADLIVGWNTESIVSGIRKLSS